MTTTRIMSNHLAPAQPCIDPNTEFGKLLSHPRVREFLRLSLAEYELQEADRKDIAAQAEDALWRRRLDADPPSNLPRLIALARKVLEGKLVDFFRHRQVERENLADSPMAARDDGREGAPDGKDQPNFVDEVRPQRSIDPEDQQQAAEQLAFVQEKLVDGTLTHDDLEVMQADHAGEKTLGALAEERGIEPAALRKRLQRIREKLKKEWNVRSTRVLVLTILMLLLLATLAVAMAGRSDPPTPPQRKDRTVERGAPRGVAPEQEAQPPNPGVGLKPY
jgi:RNA polymerase sigma factor (sigma-70 family)